MHERENEGRTIVKGQDGNDLLIANFEAEILKELRYVDGKKVERFYQIAGWNDRDGFEDVVIHSEQFAGMQWVTNSWGSQAIIYPVPAAKELLRTHIQIESIPEIETIYTHTGWIKIDGKDFYLTNGSAIGSDEVRHDITVELPADLRRFSMIDPFPTAMRDTFEIAKLGPPEVMWTLIAALFRSVVGPSDFVVHLTGRTGTFKSELAAIIQSHFGECTARELPASWNSTANALEAIAYRAKDAILVCDDFIPTGTSWQIKSYQKTADQIIRAQGNQQGRARLTDKSMLQQTMYPRGLILSTGEDTPEGHSVRGRMMIVEISPGEISTEKLSKAQENRPLFAAGMAAYIRWLAKDLKGKRKECKEIAKSTRDDNLTLGHSRTPPTLGELFAGISMALYAAMDMEVVSPEESTVLFDKARQALKAAAGRQSEYLIAADPADQFIAILRGIMAANAGHIKAKNGGIPVKALLLGWTASGEGFNTEFKPHGPRLGWCCDETGEVYLDAAVAYDTIRRHSRGAITITRQTLYKRLREAGHLVGRDLSRQRNTVRMSLEGASRQVLAIGLKTITDGGNHD